jgi:hypothetical protein
MSQIKSKYILDLNNCELFTKEHLSLHHDGFHPEVKGYEFFNQYEDCGIVYSHDQLMPIEVIDEIVDSVTNTQLYRKGDYFLYFCILQPFEGAIAHFSQWSAR